MSEKDNTNIWDSEFSRKDFLSAAVKYGACMAASFYGFDKMLRSKAFAYIGEKRGLKEASFYRVVQNGSVQCLLCPQVCVLSEGQRGFCGVREPIGTKLYSLVYGLICAIHLDPVEKKPMFHFLPGSKALSIATAGCNSRCKYCQNWAISQRKPEDVASRKIKLNTLVELAEKKDCASIAYTYTEPVVFYEYVLDSAKYARRKGIKNIMVTGGKINAEPMEYLAGYIDAANVDLKGFDRKYLKEICSQDLDTILETLLVMKKKGVWIEVTNLIVPTLNDNMSDIKKMVGWIKDNLGPDTPLHFSRFWPQYRLRRLPPTPVDTLVEARKTALESGLNYVYIGNVPGSGFENTFCPGCKKIVVERAGYTIRNNNIENGACRFCSTKISGIWG